MEETLYIIKKGELEELKSDIQEIKALVMDSHSKQSAKDETVDAKTAAAMLHISRRTLYEWTTQKRILPVTRIGRKRLYRKKAIEALIDRNTLSSN